MLESAKILVEGDLEVTVHREAAGMRVPQRGPTPNRSGFSGPYSSMSVAARWYKAHELIPRPPKNSFAVSRSRGTVSTRPSVKSTFNTRPHHPFTLFLVIRIFSQINIHHPPDTAGKRQNTSPSLRITPSRLEDGKNSPLTVIKKANRKFRSALPVRPRIFIGDFHQQAIDR